MPDINTSYDAVIVGGGHNGLTAAAYLARAGLSVLVLERQAQLGGAVQSLQVFKGINARLSRYSYLLSLFPQQIRADLELRFESRRRAVASFTPTRQNGQHQALLVSNEDEQLTAESFEWLAGDGEYRAFQKFNHLVETFAQQVWPTLLQPLQSRQQMKQRFASPEARATWEMIVEAPLGEGIERHLKHDVVRGLAFTNAKIGVLTHPFDPTLRQNRTFIYHVIGQGTGEWQVVVGGMGTLTAELVRAAREAGATLMTSAWVTRIEMGKNAAIEFHSGDKSHTVQARYVLANIAPSTLSHLLADGSMQAQVDEGSVFKINMVLKRLPRLKVKDYTPQQAFAGTFHVDEGYAAMQESYRVASNGVMPEPLPGEMYCQTMTDPSTLTPELRSAGYHTITLFGMDLPARLFREQPDATREKVLRRYLHGINQYLDEPLEDCLALDADGKPCIEAKSPVDLETELGMPSGHIFHNDLSWPFVDEPELAGSWGVETAYPNLFICGSGALRGGGVSGVTGHNAAMKVLAQVSAGV